MRGELGPKLLFCEEPVLCLGAFVGGLGDGAGVETELNLLAAFVVCDVGRGDAFHAEDLDFIAVPAGQGVLNSRETLHQTNQRIQHVIVSTRRI